MSRVSELMSPVIDRIMLILKVLCTALISAFVVIVIVSVFFRYVINDSLTWSEQVSRYLFIWMIMLGMPILYRDKANTAFDMILTKFRVRRQRAIQVALDALIVFFGVFMGVQAIRYIARLGGNMLEGIGIPQWMVYVSQPVGGFILALVALESIVLGITYLTGTSDRDEGGAG